MFSFLLTTGSYRNGVKWRSTAARWRRSATTSDGTRRRAGGSRIMTHEPTAEKIRVFAQEHNLTEEQARQLLTDHGRDEGGLTEALQSLKHFLKAPS